MFTPEIFKLMLHILIMKSECLEIPLLCIYCINYYCHVCIHTCVDAKIIPYTAPCPEPKDPNFGSVTVHYDSAIDLFVAEYTCEDDFTIVGDNQRYWLDSGHWSGREPYCVAGT